MPDSDALRIGYANAEDILFNDHKVWKAIPGLLRFRDQWALSKTSPHLRPMGKSAILDLLSAAGPDHEKALSDHFGRPVTIDRLDGKCVSNMEFDMDDPPDLEDMSAYTGFGTFRKNGRVYVTFWR